jgi:hypothetical protein
MASLKGGDKFSAALQRIAGKATSAETVKVGFLSSATYPNGTPVALVAAIQNWGAPRAGIPPRPFFSNMIAKKSPEWGPATGKLLIENDYDAAKTLAQVGEAVSGQLRQSIIDTNEPPLAPATIRRKGFSKALVDSGHMLNSVGYEVKEK